MRSKLLLIVCIAAFLITGCGNKYEKDTSYNTDLYGTFSCSIGEENSNYFQESTYIINLDNTYKYTYKEVVNDTSNENYIDGEILSIKEISDDITEIAFENDIILYKYKNMLGNLYKKEVPSDKTFDLTIPTPIDDWTGTYPNAAYVFDKDGIYHSCLDITNCNDTEENCMGIYYKYICKNNIVYFINPSIKDMDYQILYYIVDEGLFVPEYYKEK